ncbi:glycosyltransferase family 2 protein [Thermoactinomyces sp. DSM 45892]|uniref:glycosyltransferase family 2 protein n=1 Tax=Thermoactinomyces sp. DSM 45892 TaxID=1882753 RepID=UPI00089B980E|nr:glycosyltransferase family 2 protein [Thermoactinomyces sp. DSM 45892]SDZ17843.1 Glycosyl transferase family 2 [Thermoactinomyces sp. DSM 45892]
MAKISLCMIVKNEEKNLANCLASVKDVVDEIVIVDTGSTDRTKEIARKWTDRVYDFEWIDDFSAARNESFRYATKDYIFWLDADDILESTEIEKFKHLKKSLLKEKIDVVYMKYFLPSDQVESHTTRIRMVKRDLSARWEGIVHEDIRVLGNYRYTLSDVIVTHTKDLNTPSEDRRPSRRNLEIYEQNIARGHKLSIADMFNYARECSIHKDYPNAIKYFELIRDHPEISLPNNMFIYHKLATCYVLNNQPEKELELTLQSLAMDMPYPAFSCRMGEHFIKKGKIEVAIFWYKTAYLQPLSDSYSFSVADATYHTWLPHQQLAVCYESLGEKDQADFHKRQAEYYKNRLVSNTKKVNISPQTVDS